MDGNFYAYGCPLVSVALLVLAIWLNGKKASELQAKLRPANEQYASAQKALLADLGNSDLLAQVVNAANAVMVAHPPSRPEVCKHLYDLALSALTFNPTSTTLKVKALELGRAHYSALRPDRVPTVYDESAINNDIAMRAKN